MNSVLVTGCAGFIGSHLSAHLARSGTKVIGIDNLNSYYAVELKQARLEHLKQVTENSLFEFFPLDIRQTDELIDLVKQHSATKIYHLAAQAGVRHSIDNPNAYTESNLVGMASMLEVARQCAVEHMVYASSSSVYGNSTRTPYREDDKELLPISYYAATKIANEAMAQSYAHLYEMPLTGLRFFTVYGPWGRPDMAPWLFTEAIESGAQIKLFGHGKPMRDYTYVADIVAAVARVGSCPPDSADAFSRVLNIGNENPVSVIELVRTIETLTGKTARTASVGMQAGDVLNTCASIDRLKALTGFTPETNLMSGMGHFIQWYQQYMARG